MTPAQFERVTRLFEAACELDADEQAGFVEQASPDDAIVRDEVMRMLEEDARGCDAFPATPQFGGHSEREDVVEAIPERIASYRIVGLCGYGGMGTVYEAEQEYPRRRVALKVVRSRHASRQIFRRFRQEAEILGRLQHPSIAQIFEAGMHGGQPFLAMEYVDGLTLDRFVSRKELEPARRLELFARICDGVHYALGIMLFELLAERKPYELGASMLDAVRVIREEEAPRLGTIKPALRGDVETIVSKCLQKDPEQRYQSAADIRRHLGDEPILARTPSNFYQLRKLARRHRILVGGVASTMLAVIVGAILSVILAVRASNSESLARYQAYRSSISAAAGLVHVDPIDARRYLDDAPAEFRNWEWNYLSARLAQRLNSCRLEERTAAAPVFAADEEKAYYFTGAGTLAAWHLNENTTEELLIVGTPVAATAFNATGSHFAALLPDGTITAYDLTEKQPIDVPAITGLAVNETEQVGIAWKADGSSLAIVRGGSLFTWNEDAPEWQRVAVNGSSVSRVRDLAWAGNEDRVIALLVGRTDVNNRIVVFDANSGATSASHDHVEMAFCQAVSPDTRHVAVGYGVRSIRVLRLDDLSEVARLGGHLSEVNAINWSRDSQLLVSAGNDRTVRIWDRASLSQQLVIHQEDAEHVAFSPDNARLLIHTETELHHWDASIKFSTVLSGHQSYPYNIAYSPDGTLLASTTFFESECRLWDPLRGTSVASLDPGLHRTLSLAFTNDGTRLILGRMSGYQCIHVVDPFTGKIDVVKNMSRNTIFQGFTLWRVLHAGALSSDSLKHLVDRATDSIWRIEFGGEPGHSSVRIHIDGREAATHQGEKAYEILPHPHPFFIGSLANLGYHFQGKMSELILFDERLEENEAEAIQAYLDARRSGQTIPFPEVSSANLIARFVADPSFVEVDEENHVMSWRAINNPELIAHGRGNAKENIRYSPASGDLAVSFAPVTTDHPDLPSERRLQLTLPASVRISRGSVYWLGRFDGWGYPWGLGLARESSPILLSMMRDNGVDLSNRRLSTAQVLHPDGTFIANTGCRGGDNNGAVILDAKTFAWIDELGEGYSGLAIHPAGKKLAGAGINGIEIWDLPSRTLDTTLKGHHTRVYCVDYSPDGTRLASGGNDNTIRIWDTATGEQLLELRGHDQYVKDIRFSPDGRQIASASGDYTIRIWDSVSPNQRRILSESARKRELACKPRMLQRLTAGETPDSIAASLREDQSLTSADRLAALRALVECVQDTVDPGND